MGSMSIWHWLIVLVIVLMMFGTRKLRNVGADLGGAVRDFKIGMNEGDGSSPLPGDVVDSRVSSSVASHTAD